MVIFLRRDQHDAQAVGGHDSFYVEMSILCGGILTLGNKSVRRFDASTSTGHASQCVSGRGSATSLHRVYTTIVSLSLYECSRRTAKRSVRYQVNLHRPCEDDQSMCRRVNARGRERYLV